MRYIITILIFIAFIGCGQSNNRDKTDNKSVVKESFPSNVKREKTPPAIPEI